MWAQLITMRLKPGQGDDLPELFKQLEAAEQPDSGLLRTTFMRDQSDPSRVYTLVVFESEEKARAREQDERRSAALDAARALMGDMFDGPPEFVDLNVVADRAV
jgi:quinol monooxygenase YgiN